MNILEKSGKNLSRMEAPYIAYPIGGGTPLMLKMLKEFKVITAEICLFGEGVFWVSLLVPLQKLVPKLVPAKIRISVNVYGKGLEGKWYLANCATSRCFRIPLWERILCLKWFARNILLITPSITIDSAKVNIFTQIGVVIDKNHGK